MTDIKYIGLLDKYGEEIIGCERQPANYIQKERGVWHLDSDVIFDVPAGSKIYGYSNYVSRTGETRFFDSELTPEEFTNDGQYTIYKSKITFNRIKNQGGKNAKYKR